MAGIDRPLQDLVNDAKTYVGLQADDLKLQITKGLSLSLGQVIALVLAVVSLSIVLLAIGAGCVILLGNWLGNYAIASFIVAGVFAVLTVILFLLKNKLFVNGFVRLFAKIFFEDRRKSYDTQRTQKHPQSPSVGNGSFGGSQQPERLQKCHEKGFQAH